MKSFINPANPLMFDVEGYYQQSQLQYTSQFAPLWWALDSVQIQVSENVPGNFISRASIDYDPCPINSIAGATPTFDPLGATSNLKADPSTLTRYARWAYTHPDGSAYTTPTYLITEDECVLRKTVLIRYYNNDRLLGGNQYPDIDYSTGFMPNIRVYGSLDSDGMQDIRNFSTDGVGISSLCRVESQPVWRLTVGPAPDWLHRKMQYVFMHQNVEVQKFGSNIWIPLVPFSTYEQTQQLGERTNLWIGSGRLITDEHGVVTC